jgi:hypothetical protein
MEDDANNWTRLGTLTTRLAARLASLREAEIQQGSAAEDRREPGMTKSAADLGAVKTEIDGGGAPPRKGVVDGGPTVRGDVPPARAVKAGGKTGREIRDSTFDEGAPTGENVPVRILSAQRRLLRVANAVRRGQSEIEDVSRLRPRDSRRAAVGLRCGVAVPAADFVPAFNSAHGVEIG